MGGRTSAKSKNAWNARNYDSIAVRVPKGAKETVREYAQTKGLSVNGLIAVLLKDAVTGAGYSWPERAKDGDQAEVQPGPGVID